MNLNLGTTIQGKTRKKQPLIYSTQLKNDEVDTIENDYFDKYLDATVKSIEKSTNNIKLDIRRLEEGVEKVVDEIRQDNKTTQRWVINTGIGTVATIMAVLAIIAGTFYFHLGQQSSWFKCSITSLNQKMDLMTIPHAQADTQGNNPTPAPGTGHGIVPDNNTTTTAPSIPTPVPDHTNNSSNTSTAQDEPPLAPK